MMSAVIEQRPSAMQRATHGDADSFAMLLDPVLRGDRESPFREQPVSSISSARLRTLLPAVGFTAPLPAQASNVNNCGVKGGYAYGGYAYAFHDHGKPCPNRPFPGKGEGLVDRRRHRGREQWQRN